MVLSGSCAYSQIQGYEALPHSTNFRGFADPSHSGSRRVPRMKRLSYLPNVLERLLCETFFAGSDAFPRQRFDVYGFASEDVALLALKRNEVSFHDFSLAI